MSESFDLSGRTAVVTGAGGGIGAAISASLARRGCHVALADINSAGLVRTMEALRMEALSGLGIEVSTHILDVGDAEAVAAFPRTVLARHGTVDILVNNAGVALGGTFEDISPRNFEWLMDINFWGVVRMTRAFLPHLKERPEARIVNLSSIFGIIAPLHQTAYCASKFAVRGFSESLRHELEASSVGVTVVHPGGIKTSIARNARAPEGYEPSEIDRHRNAFERQLKMSPERAGEIIVAALERRRPRVLVGGDAKIAAIIERLMPVGHWNLIRRLTGA